MTHGSLFSGIGGFDLAAEWMGWQNIFHCEWAEFQRKILDYYFPKAISYHDIRKTDFRKHRGRIDVLSGGFPCFVAGTPVLTSRGFIPIEDVRLGDYVLSTDQKYHEVECLMTHPADDIVYLRAQGMFEELKCTPNHPFYVRRRKTYYKKGRKCTEYEEPQYINASDLKKGDKVGYPIHEGEDKSFTLAFWKLVGTWIADGWIDNNTRKSKIPKGNRGSRVNSRNHKVIICCGKKNIAHLHHIIQNAGYKYTLSEDRTVYKAIICDKWLCEFLKDFGKHAHGKKLSPQCFRLDNERKRSLFEGWLTDGYVENNGSYKVTTVSEELALGMAQVARDAYRCPVSLSKKRVNRDCYIEGRLVNERPQYQVTVSNNSKYGFYNNGFVWCNVKTIRTEKEINQVYNLSVNEEHSYNVYGIAVHNCQPFSVAGKRKGSEDDRYLWDEMLRAIREIRPTWVVGENVAGLLSMVQPGETIRVENQTTLFQEDCKKIETIESEFVLKTIRRDLRKEGYSVQPILIPACAIGAPHRRDRVWIIAYRTDSRAEGVQLGWQDGVHELGFATDTDSSSVKGQYKCGSRENELDRRDCQEAQTRWENFPTQSPICSGDDGLSARLDGITFPQLRRKSIEGYGNAIVPQLAYRIFKAIEYASGK